MISHLHRATLESAHFPATRAKLAQFKASGNLDRDAALRLIRNNIRDAERTIGTYHSPAIKRRVALAILEGI